MDPARHEYKGHVIELRAREAPDAETVEAGGAAPPLELRIDAQPVAYGQLPDGSYFLHEYAYDWRADLVELAQRLIDHRAQGTPAADGREGR